MARRAHPAPYRRSPAPCHYRHPPVSRQSGVFDLLIMPWQTMICADVREYRLSTVTCGHRAPQVHVKAHP